VPDVPERKMLLSGFETLSGHSQSLQRQRNDLSTVICVFFFFFFFLFFIFYFFFLNNLSESRMVHLQELVMDSESPASFQRDLPNVVHTALITSPSGHSAVPIIFVFFPTALSYPVVPQQNSV